MKGGLSLIALGGILAAWAPLDQTRALVRPLPDALAARPVDAAALDAIASGTMADLARILAEHEISAGFVFTQDERRQTGHARRRRGTMVALGDVIARFTAAHPSYAAGTIAGVPFFGPDESDCGRALGRRLPKVDIEDRLIWQAFADLALQFDPPPDPSIPPGIAQGGGVLSDRPLVMTARVSLRRQSVSVLDAFQEISRQAPGLVWWIAEDPNRYPNRMACIVNEFYPGGASFSNHDVNRGGH